MADPENTKILKYIYRQSPVKSPDIKNIIVVTLTFFSTLAKIHTTTAREPSIYL